mmetsp:Transcript_59230/g.131965  ORF Transcript_59230/g.131965 Transcript_59230/m.131965 type:complete len:229 (+) Transcript_59230:916-1602(+)
MFRNDVWMCKVHTHTFGRAHGGADRRTIKRSSGKVDPASGGLIRHPQPDIAALGQERRLDCHPHSEDRSGYCTTGIDANWPVWREEGRGDVWCSCREVWHRYKTSSVARGQRPDPGERVGQPRRDAVGPWVTIGRPGGCFVAVGHESGPLGGEELPQATLAQAGRHRTPAEPDGCCSVVHLARVAKRLKNPVLIERRPRANGDRIRQNRLEDLADLVFCGDHLGIDQV